MSKSREDAASKAKLEKQDSPKSVVALARCASYDRSDILSALQLLVKNLGGLQSTIKPGSHVFVKINHLSPSSPPERAILTHPAFAREVIALLLDFGAKVTVGDDIQSSPGDGFSRSGYCSLCSELGVRLVNLKEAGFREVEVRGELIKKAYIARPVLEADAMVNLPKLKTHSFTVFTGAIKNLFGLIPHGLRLHYHRQFIRNEVFARMLVDLFSCVPPQLNIMDAIVGMEGEGPSSGYPRKIGLVLASRDAVALDAVATQIIGLDPLGVPTTAIAHTRKLGVGDLRQVEILGPSLEEVTISGFRHSVAAVSLFRRWLPSFLYAYFQEQLVLVPEVEPRICQVCQECVRMCPRQAIGLVDGSAFIHKADCIHCLCCHEVCQHRAIRLKQRFLGRLIRKAEGMLGQLNKLRVLRQSPASANESLETKRGL